MAALRWIAATLLVAAIAHLGSTWYLPRYIMGRVMDGVAAIDGHNVFVNRPVATAEARTIVRPSPDLLYSICVVDLSKGPVRIQAAPSEPYTSVSVFAANSDNVFVMNDRELAPGAQFDVWVAHGDQSVPVSAPVAEPGSTRAIVLVRRVVTGEAQLREIDALRQQARCTAQ